MATNVIAKKTSASRLRSEILSRGMDALPITAPYLGSGIRLPGP